MVYLNSKNITSTWPSKKLDFKFYRLYKVDVSVGKQAYCLKLLPSMKIQNVFYVFLLEPGKSQDGTKTAPPLVIVDNNEKYKMEEILNSRHHYNKLQYLVKWLGYLMSDNQWVFAGNIGQSQEFVDFFHKIYLDKPSSLIKKCRERARDSLSNGSGSNRVNNSRPRKQYWKKRWK